MKAGVLAIDSLIQTRYKDCGQGKLWIVVACKRLGDI
jgi:hypothetical protein